MSFSSVFKAAAAAVCLFAIASAAELSGTIKDPSGAAVPGAAIVLQAGGGQTLHANSDASGHFQLEAPDGTYTLTVRHAGFSDYQQPVIIAGNAKTLVVGLQLAEVRQVQLITGRSLLGNSDSLYRSSRDATLKETFAVDNLVLKRDAAALTLKHGTITLGTPVGGKVTMAVFVGEGVFSLKPAVPAESRYLQSLTGKDAVEEPFERALLVFSDGTGEEIRGSVKTTASEPRAQSVLENLRKRVRQRRDFARSIIEDLVQDESMANVDADIAADLYNPKRPGFFNAYIEGRNYQDLRFYVNPRGVFAGLPSAEEVALVHLNPGGAAEGLLYHAHLTQEYEKGTADSHEVRRDAAAEHYRIETVIGNNDHLTSVAELRFRAFVTGDRVVKFGLLPNLRVTRVALEGGKEIPFVQQAPREDGSFYVFMPAPMKAGSSYTITAEYAGDRVVQKAGGGNFAVGARTSWYPSLNAFADRSTFDLTFKYPKKYKFVGVGKLAGETKEGDFNIAHWTSDVPLAVAGFNFGDFKVKRLEDPKTKYAIEGYATSQLPDSLFGARDIGGMSPSVLLEHGMAEAQASIQIFENFFGKAPYGRIAITQQPQMFFGQSWPTLVYLPIVAFFDSTQRFELMGGNSRSLNQFVDEVTAHEVSHQWWGHMVGWSTYHDQWLSEGFASFSAGLFLQATERNPGKYLKYWEHARDNLLAKNEHGLSPNDAGPIALGLRLSTFKNPQGYSTVTYEKGAYVLHMLRHMMWDRETGDAKFKAMMKDFVKSYVHNNASTESFREVVERHMTPGMDLQGNKSMEWFFRQWVYGTEIPRYKFEYTTTPQDGGKVLLKAKLSQSEVSDDFRMLVPVYVDTDGGRPVRIGAAAVRGNSTVDLNVVLPKKPKEVTVNAFYDVLAKK